MKKRSIICLLLIAVILFSCAEPAEIVSPESEPIPEDYSNATVTYVYEYKSELVTHIEVGDKCWWDFDNVYYQMRGPESGQKKTKEIKPWAPDMLPHIEPNSTVEITVTISESFIQASSAVSNFLESGDKKTEKDFVILFIDAKAGYLSKFEYGMTTEEERKEWLYRWCGYLGVDGDVIGNTGHILWENKTAEDLNTLNKWVKSLGVVDRPHTFPSVQMYEEGGVLVCFLEEVEALYGVTFEQADILYEKGYLDGWCTASYPLCEDSPLYGLNPAEIAAYIAEHPEILEE